MQPKFVQLNTEDKDLINSSKQSHRESHTVLMFT